LAKHKGIFTLLRAVEGCDPLRLVLAGSGPEERPIRRHLQEKNMVNVDLAGFVTGARKAQLMREASFLVLASEWYENCPLVVMEAFANGKPVVASDIGGIPEQVTHGFNGLLFEPGNASELRERLLHLLSHPDEITRMGRNARKTAEELYSPQHHYRRLMGVYEEAIRRNRRRAAGEAAPATEGVNGPLELLGRRSVDHG
jgi:glycosyltransferase involved in cell wall biosynthesis